MKKLLLTMVAGLIAFNLSAQFQKVTVRDIQFVPDSKLKNCVDSANYYGDTVSFVAKVIADANLIDVPSSSVQGGFRPFVHVVDTANKGTSGDFRGIQVMGVYQDAQGNDLPVNDVYNLYAGMVVEITGVVGSYQGETQVSILNNSSLTVLSTESAPTAVTINLGDLNDNTRTNQLETGEEYEGSFVKIEDLTVTAVYNFSGNRVSFDLTDDDGNVINVSDRFLVQKTPSYTTSRASAPYSQGKFQTPVVGTRFDHIMGIIIHSQNGCTGSNGRGYEINPFDESHYLIGVTPPNISEVDRDPLVPGDQDDVKISAKIVDFDGEVSSASLFWTDDPAKSFDQFTEVTMTVKSGTTDEFEATIPKAADGTVIRYYITADDDDAQKSYAPFGAKDPKNPDFSFYTVRNNGLSIADLQRVINLDRGDSPYEDQEVTVTGVVTASAKQYDLEAIYIQDPSESEFAGIQCAGNSDLIKLYRGQEVTVTGTVSENFGFTVLNVSSVDDVVTPSPLVLVEPTIIDINDTAWFTSSEGEKYEGMLIGFNNPGGTVAISDPMLNPFGEWLIGADEDAPFNRSVRVQSGIQNNNNHSSLWVSLVGDTTLAEEEGVMNVSPIENQKGMTFDTIIGINFYGFGSYKLLPRNDDDFKGSSVTLPATNYPAIVGIEEVNLSGFFSVYPNPSHGTINVRPSEFTGNEFNVTITDIQGKVVAKSELDHSNYTMDITSLKSGVYFMTISVNDVQLSNAKIIKH